MSASIKFANGGVRELFNLSFPIFLALLSSCMMSFCDRCFLSKYSLDAFEGVCIGGYLALIFQALCIHVTSINQTFISRVLGKKQEDLVGSYTWQMIWFSLLTNLVIIPAGLVTSFFYFDQTAIQLIGREYFLIMVIGNSLFAFGAAFMGFQSGIGETKILTVAAVISNICNFILNYFLIFGVEGIIPPLGVKGAALGTLISQGVYCLTLFFSFFNHKDAQRYQNRNCHFSFPLLWKLLKVGIPRTTSRFFNLLYWILAIKILAKLDESYILALSYGATLWFLISALSEALGKAIISPFSFHLEANHWHSVWGSFRSGLILLFLAFGILAFPLVIFSEFLIQKIISEPIPYETLHMLKLTSLWVWGYFLIEGIGHFGISLIVAMKKTAFAMKFNILTGGFTIFLPYYLCFYVFHFSADKVWMVNWFVGVVVICAYFGKALLTQKKGTCSGGAFSMKI